MNDYKKILDNKYNRKVCKECEYKIICAGECEKTINNEIEKGGEINERYK